MTKMKQDNIGQEHVTYQKDRKTEKDQVEFWEMQNSIN